MTTINASILDSIVSVLWQVHEIKFDTGGMRISRDWYIDWSFKVQ